MKNNNPQVVLLCGGSGTRLREETEFKPKPLVEVGGLPILLHIMKAYSHFGFRDFILCLGYKGEMIKEFFMNYEWRTNDFTLNLKSGREYVAHHKTPMEDWKVTFADTGDKTLTSERLMLIRKYLNDCPYFLATYGDGVSDINVNELVDFHKKTGKIATLTGVHPSSKYGIVEASDSTVTSFMQKPALKDFVNGGFFVFNKEIFDHLRTGEMLEVILDELIKIKQLSIYKYEGFWRSMDTYKDVKDLNALWDRSRPWKVWE